MDLGSAEALAVRLIDRHINNSGRLNDEGRERFRFLKWKFEWHNQKRNLGTCCYTYRTIYLSTHWTQQLPDGEVLDTILHEIAHAIAGDAAGHGPVWQAVAVEVGAKPERTYTGEDSLRHLYTWGLFRKDTGDMVRGYYRRPSAGMLESIHRRGLRGHPGTKGQLEFRPLGDAAESVAVAARSARPSATTRTMTVKQRIFALCDTYGHDCARDDMIRRLIDNEINANSARKGYGQWRRFNGY